MVKRKSVCGLCKPDKKWKQVDTKAKQMVRKELELELSAVWKNTRLV